MTFEEYFKQRNPKYGFLIRYMKEALNITAIDFSDITVINFRSIKDYILNKVSNNSARHYFSVIKATCRELITDGYITNSKCIDTLKVKKTPSEQVFCTEEEIEKMDLYYDALLKLKGKQEEKDCLCLFLLENITGARTSDCVDLSINNISDGKLSYISKKTKQKSVMPAHSKLIKYLQHMPKKNYSNTTKGRIIKRVAKKCGINETVTLFYRGKQMTGPKWKFIATHTGRRDFATHLALRGAPLTEICQFMNHRQNVTQTMRYIIPDMNNVSNESMSFFNKE